MCRLIDRRQARVIVYETKTQPRRKLKKNEKKKKRRKKYCMLVRTDRISTIEWSVKGGYQYTHTHTHIHPNAQIENSLAHSALSINRIVVRIRGLFSLPRLYICCFFNSFLLFFFLSPMRDLEKRKTFMLFVLSSSQLFLLLLLRE